jgi:hypothetical protein
MQKLSPSDLWPLPVYEQVRDQFRREVIAAKQHRRAAVGPIMTFVFENRLTVKFQVQEILRIEKIANPAAVQEELDGFNEMLPGPGELSATLLIELTGEEKAVAEELRKLTGLADHVWLELGRARVQARFDGGRDDGRRVSAVQYLRFPGASRAALLDLQTPAAVLIDHPNYRHRAELGEGARRSLAADLADGGAAEGGSP